MEYVQVATRLPPAEYLRRLRDSPFLRLSQDAIRERAYFLSLENPDRYPSDHWLEAEEAETVIQVRNQLSCFTDPRHAHLSQVLFEEEYIKRQSWYFAPGDSSSLARCLGKRDPLRCSICQRSVSSVPSAKFKNVSHLVPEMLGNRWLTTYDECNDCNARFGKEYENDLGRMTHPIRALARIRGKRGTAKLKPRGDSGKSFLGGGEHLGALQINVDYEDPSVTMKFDGNQGLSITAHAPSFRPSRAAKALARIAWQALPEDRRPEHTALRDWLNSDVIGKTALYDIAALNFYGLAVGLWERQPSSADTLPQLVPAVGFTGKILVWASPNWSTGEYQPSPFPHLPHRPDGSPPTVTLYTHRDDETVPSHTSTYHLTHQGSSPGDFDIPRPGRIEFDSLPGAASGPVSISTYVTRRRTSNTDEVGEDYRAHEIGGDEFKAQIFILRWESGERSLHYPAEPPPDSNEKTLAFFAALKAGQAFKVFLKEGMLVHHPGRG